MGVSDDSVRVSEERLAVLAAFIRGQCALTDKHPHTAGPGSVTLNNEEALLCADALAVMSALREAGEAKQHTDKCNEHRAFHRDHANDCICATKWRMSTAAAIRDGVPETVVDAAAYDALLRSLASIAGSGE